MQGSADVQDELLCQKLKSLEKKASQIFYFDSQNYHPIIIFKSLTRRLMHRHNQESYNAILTHLLRENGDSKENTVNETQTNNDDVFENGPIGPYQNGLMMQDYINHIEENTIDGKDYFEYYMTKCSTDPNLPKSKDEFRSYALAIADYAIPGRYVKGGANRGVYDQLMTDCWKWCDEKYRSLERKGELDPFRRFTIILCHILLKVNLYEKHNMLITRFLARTSGFNSFDARTPTTKQLSNTLLLTARGSVIISNVNNKDVNVLEDKKLAESGPALLIEQLGNLMMPFAPDMLTYSEMQNYIKKEHLHEMNCCENTLDDSFWEDREEISSLLNKAIDHINKSMLTLDLTNDDRINLSEYIKALNSHKTYYQSKKQQFTELFREIFPDDFMSKSEQQELINRYKDFQKNILTLIDNINILIEDEPLLKTKMEKLTEFISVIKNLISYYEHNLTVYDVGQSFNPAEFLKPDKYFDPPDVDHKYLQFCSTLDPKESIIKYKKKDAEKPATDQPTSTQVVAKSSNAITLTKLNIAQSSDHNVPPLLLPASPKMANKLLSENSHLVKSAPSSPKLDNVTNVINSGTLSDNNVSTPPQHAGTRIRRAVSAGSSAELHHPGKFLTVNNLNKSVDDQKNEVPSPKESKNILQVLTGIFRKKVVEDVVIIPTDNPPQNVTHRKK